MSALTNELEILLSWCLELSHIKLCQNNSVGFLNELETEDTSSSIECFCFFFIPFYIVLHTIGSVFGSVNGRCCSM